MTTQKLSEVTTVAIPTYGTTRAPVGPSPIVVLSVVLLCTVGVVGVVVVSIFTDAAERALLITTILGFLATSIGALLTLLKSTQNAGKLDQIHIALNGRLQQLLDATAQGQHAAGVVAGLQQASLVGSDPTVVTEPESPR